MDLSMVLGMLGIDPAQVEVFKQRAIEGVQDADKRLKGVEITLAQITAQNAIIQQQQLEILTQLGATQNAPGNHSIGNDSNRNESAGDSGSAGG